MKAFKSLVLIAGVALSSLAFANLEGSWKMSEGGQEKAIIKFTKTGDTYSATMTKGLTDKAKKREGAVVMTDIKEVGSGKYKGKGKHPTLPIKGTVNISVNGNTMTIKSVAGTQTGVKQ